MYKDIELRKLPVGSLCNIVNILETNNDWKKVMSIIPKNPRSNLFEAKYNNEHLRLILEHSKTTGAKCTEILLDEWSTSGKIRPTLSTLKEVVLKAEIYRAADEIAIMLQEPLPARPNFGPAAPITTNITLMLNGESMDQNSYEHSLETNAEIKRAIHNNTTRQMKSASDLINFSSSINSSDIPNMSVLQSFCNKTTAQIKSKSNLIKLSDASFEGCTLESRDIPNLSAMNKYSESTLNTNTEFNESSDYMKKTNETSMESINSDSVYQKSLPNIDLLRTENRIDSEILRNENLLHFEYRTLQSLTNNFAENLTNGENGLIGKIGSGGFGEVFVGCHGKFGYLAVKKAHNFLSMGPKPDLAVKVFNAEVKYLSQFKHPNIVPILGYSRDGPALCIVCEYIDGGSLEERLAAKVLSEIQRINIMKGTAEGLKYLHRNENQNLLYDGFDSDSHNLSKKNNFVHGDVKSANILLTKNCNPKLCDFGLAKQFDQTFITTSPMGTSAYMAPEGFSGTITQKNDIYSYGIVLLEILTGLKPIVVKENEKINIRDYIEENSPNDDISHLLDPVAKWSVASIVYELGKQCLKRQRQSRPSIDEICEVLNSIKHSDNQ